MAVHELAVLIVITQVVVAFSCRKRGIFLLSFRQYASDITAQLAAVIDRCLEPETQKRFESGEKLLDALELDAPEFPDSLSAVPSAVDEEWPTTREEPPSYLLLRELLVLHECNLGRLTQSTVALDEDSIGWVDRHGQAFVSSAHQGATVVHLRSPREEAFSIALRSEKELVATGHDNGMVCLWSKAGRLLKLLNGGGELPTCHIKLSPDGAWVVAVDGGMCMYIFETESGACLHTSVLESLDALEFGYDGYTLFSGDSMYILQPGAVIYAGGYQGECLEAVAPAHDGRSFASLDSVAGLSLRYIDEGVIYRVLDMEARGSRVLRTNPSDTLLAELGQVALLRVHSLTEHYALHVTDVEPGVCTVAFSGERIVRLAGGRGDELVIWEIHIPEQPTR